MYLFAIFHKVHPYSTFGLCSCFHYVCTLAQLNLQPPGAFEIPLTSINCYAFRRIMQISISELHVLVTMVLHLASINCL